MTAHPPTLGDYIRTCRGSESQIALSARVGVSQAALSRWECNRSTPTLGQLARLAEVLPGFLVPVAATYARSTGSEERT